MFHGHVYIGLLCHILWILHRIFQFSGLAFQSCIGAEWRLLHFTDHGPMQMSTDVLFPIHNQIDVAHQVGDILGNFGALSHHLFLSLVHQAHLRGDDPEGSHPLGLEPSVGLLGLRQLLRLFDGLL